MGKSVFDWLAVLESLCPGNLSIDSNQQSMLRKGLVNQRVGPEADDSAPADEERTWSFRHQFEGGSASDQTLCPVSFHFTPDAAQKLRCETTMLGSLNDAIDQALATASPTEHIESSGKWLMSQLRQTITETLLRSSCAMRPFCDINDSGEFLACFADFLLAHFCCACVCVFFFL